SSCHSTAAYASLRPLPTLRSSDLSLQTLPPPPHLPTSFHSTMPPKLPTHIPTHPLDLHTSTPTRPPDLQTSRPYLQTSAAQCLRDLQISRPVSRAQSSGKGGEAQVQRWQADSRHK